jgi:hypothetical protein
MAIPRRPNVDDWYEDEGGRSFRVIAVDEDDGTIEVQYFDGDVEEFDRDSWYQMSLEPIEEPEDWTGPFDDLEADDVADNYRTESPTEWEESAPEEPDYDED